jgi:hypothetical protein
MHANLTPFENEVPIFINPYSRADGESWVARAMLAVEASKIQWHPMASKGRTVSPGPSQQDRVGTGVPTYSDSSTTVPLLPENSD